MNLSNALRFDWRLLTVIYILGESMNGFLIIDKPGGWTSFDVVAKVRRIMGIKKIGHTGTLDPMATGIMVLMLGRTAKLLNYLPNTDKRYTASVKLGAKTDTLDKTGSIVAASQRYVDIGDIKRVLTKFVGEIEQVPPMYSAVKKDGVRLYDLARQGKEVYREKRKVRINSINLLSFDEQERRLILDITCSSGTYIRTLADDIGEILGTYAHLDALRRTSACGFDENISVKIEDINASEPFKHVIAADTAFKDFSSAYVSPAQSVRLINGGWLDMDRVDIKDGSMSELVRIYDGNGFLGLGNIDIKNGSLKPACIIRI